MNEALVFIAIVIATILEGILGALLVVPLLASVVVIADYVLRRVLGLSPFEDDGSQQFVMPEEKINPPVRKWGRRKTDRMDEIPAADVPLTEELLPSAPAVDVAAPMETESFPEPIPAGKKTQK
jgi:hypothetical protein